MHAAHGLSTTVGDDDASGNNAGGGGEHDDDTGLDDGGDMEGLRGAAVFVASLLYSMTDVLYMYVTVPAGQPGVKEQ